MTELVEDDDRFVLTPADVAIEPKAKRSRPPKVIADGARPPNLGEPLRVATPDFSDPNRAKTCLEADFPIVPINALSSLEGNAGKPIYQMGKWWARRRSSVFRAMLIAAAMEAPARKNPDGSPVRDDLGRPVPDETEAAKAVWDAYYANHQAAGNFRHLKVLDLFMGGGTTLVEGSRLGFQVAGVDLNPVAWFIVKNELSCADPAEVRELFDRVEAEVKPQIQPFYATECPRGHRGVWSDTRTGQPAAIDPATLSPEGRTHYRYEGPEAIYTFWAKHGPCRHPECGHRTPVFRNPVIAEKKLGVKYLDLTCKSCKLAFHAELGSARMAPGAERVVLENEVPFTELSLQFASRLLEYSKGGKGDKTLRVAELCEMVEGEPGLRCPSCGQFAGQWLRDVLKMHRGASRISDIDKKHLKILPERNGTKPVYSYLLVHPEWLKGSPGVSDGQELGGFAGAHPVATSAWYAKRLEGLRLIEVRGSVRLAEELALSAVYDPEHAQGGEAGEADESEAGLGADEEDRKLFGLPRFITLADGQAIDTRKGTVPESSHFECAACGQRQDLRLSVQSRGQTAPVSPYAIQCSCPACAQVGHIYGGRFFASPTEHDIRRLSLAETDWFERRDRDLDGCWPREEIPFTYMTHQANFALPEQGYTHWWKMFNARQLLIHTQLMRAVIRSTSSVETKHCVLGAFQNYLRNQCMFAFWHKGRDHFAPHFGNPNYSAKINTIEVGHWAPGYGSLPSVIETVIEGLRWAQEPWEACLPDGSTKSLRLQTGDPVLPTTDIRCTSSTDLDHIPAESVDLVVTDPPFGDNIFYSDLSNFFHAWLRLPLRAAFPELFGPTKTPSAQEALKPRTMREDDANEHYRSLLTPCWMEAHRILKPGGLLAFTFHHSEDAQWEIVLRSLFDAGFLLEQTFPIASDEMKGEGGQFGAKGTEYDIIHVCRKRLDDPTRVSWPKMRQWVRAELGRLRRLLESYRARELSDADVRVILRGKALEFYSRHYGEVFTGEDEPLSIRHALLGINQLLDEASSTPEERPPGIVQPVAYQFLQLFGGRASLPRDEVGKSLRGTGISQREFELRGWTREESRTVLRVPIPERFEALRRRPRKEMKTEIDQAHFLIGAALPGSGVNIEQELAKDTWMVKRTVEAVLGWYEKTAPEPETRRAAALSTTLLRQAIERRRVTAAPEQGLLFDDLDLEDDL